MPRRQNLWVQRPRKKSKMEADQSLIRAQQEYCYYLTLHEFAESVIKIEPTVPFSLYRERLNEETEAKIIEDLRYFRQPWSIHSQYPEASRNLLLLCARQVGKTTLAAAMGLTYQMIHPGYRMLYVQPTLQQVQVISTSRYAKIVECSPVIHRDFWSTKNIWQLKHRQLNNKSEAYFRSCYLSVESSRGITAEGLHVDEFQDMIPDNIGVLEHCQDRVDSWKFLRILSATPYSKINHASQYFYDSCQYEWHTECQHCGHWNFLDDKIIGKYFYECTRCHKEIYPKNCDHGQWIAMNPSKIPTVHGYRIPQIISPSKEHSHLLAAKNNTLRPYYQFLNENLGLPSDEGNIQLTEEDIKKACLSHSGNMLPSEIYKKFTKNFRLYMGIDWGAGEIKSSGAKSLSRKGNLITTAFTVITIGGWVSGKFIIFYIEKLLGDKAELDGQPEYVDKVARAYRVDYVASDWGYGADKNAVLRKKYGWRTRVGESGTGPIILECQNVGQDANKEVVYDAKASHYAGRYRLNKRWLIAETLLGIKERERIKFPTWNFLSKHPIEALAIYKDFMNIFKEFDTSRGKYVFGSMGIDDAFFALALCYYAGRHAIHEIVPVPLYQLAIEDQEAYLFHD